MPYCSAFGCRNRSGKGKTFHRFPRDPGRREKWETQVQKKAWKSHLNSFLCEDHFDETQYESHRADGLRKLKPYAIPTLLVLTKPKPSPNQHMTAPVVPQEPSDGATKKISQDHSYCTTSVGTAEPEIPISESSADDDREHVIPDCQPNHAALDLMSNIPTLTVNAPHPSCAVVNCEEKLKALRNKVLRLQQTLAKERREKWKVLRQRKQLEEKVSRVFNKDQFAKLCQSSTRGSKWSAETIKKGLQLQLVCGAAGYELLLAQNQPLPSARSLRRIVAQEKRNNAVSL